MTPSHYHATIDCWLQLPRQPHLRHKTGFAFVLYLEECQIVQLFQISVSCCVGHVERLGLFISASYDRFILQLQLSSAVSGRTILPVELFLATSA
ncbi:hypothetical protein AVEN_35415-1 [Araneus ventricosus]|uniref:Uncharacterized protein n=1 Tax=Araneus ventricosus TaxID=182803 RepID=A0A4Y2NRY4_ARAVE|nr:hypothetical protein AVEN_35415-1 [Araneus ventricosus]